MRAIAPAQKSGVVLSYIQNAATLACEKWLCGITLKNTKRSISFSFSVASVGAFLFEAILFLVSVPLLVLYFIKSIFMFFVAFVSCCARCGVGFKSFFVCFL